MAAARLEFVKLQGLGNDYVYVDGVERGLPAREADMPALARGISDRHFGVGADGLIAVLRGERAPFRMRIWNADGSEAEMCGNGLRCVAKYVYEQGYASSETVEVETLAGVLRASVFPEGGRVARVRVDMGWPQLTAVAVPEWATPAADGGVRLIVDGVEVVASCVALGNPHCVLFVPAVAAAPVHTLGPRLEHHPAFPQGVNVEFVAVLGSRELDMRVWERGSGETLACGTGACAAAVAAAAAGRAERSVTVHLPGGDLEVAWGTDDRVQLTGPAVEVFRGVYDPR